MIVFEVFYQFLRFGNQFTVPAIACPTPCAGMSGSDFGILCMPSHIEHHDIEGKVVFTIFPYQLAIIFVCVVPPAAMQVVSSGHMTLADSTTEPTRNFTLAGHSSDC
jgi:hypothetical protein